MVLAFAIQTTAQSTYKGWPMFRFKAKQHKKYRPHTEGTEGDHRPKRLYFRKTTCHLGVTPSYHALPLAEMLPKPPNIGKSSAKQEKRAQSGKHLHFSYARLARVSPSRSLRSHTTPQLHQTKKQQRHIKPHTNQKSNAATVK